MTANNNNNNHKHDASSSSSSSDAYKPGSITRVKLHNFLTYANVEFSPGPRLNVVVGPNGTGKSTLLCAICLGLGGQPPLLGRADDARLFIMHEQDVAEVEIELQPHDSRHVSQSPSLLEDMGDFPLDHSNNNSNDNNNSTNSRHVFRRVIDRNEGSTSDRSRGQGASKYYINGRLTSLKTVKHIVQHVYGIQIDNLCTFLPQDKVGSFSGFGPSQLLQETEKCLLQKWHEVHLKLIQLEQDVLQSGNSVEHVQEELQKLQKEQELLEQQKELMEQRKEAELLKVKLDQKMAWVKFDGARESAVALNELRKQCKAALKQAKSALAPLLEEKETSLELVQRSKANSSHVAKSVHTLDKQYDKHLHAKFERCEEEMEDCIAELNSMDSQQRKAQKKAEHQEKIVEEAQGVLSQFEPREVLKEKKDTLQREAHVLQKENNKIRREQGSLQSKEHLLKEQMGDVERKLHKLEDHQTQRRNAIFQRDPNLAKTYTWLDENRKQFRHAVHGPICCAVQVDGSRGAHMAKKAASYLEQHVSQAVWKQYVVESRDDYNLLYNELRTKRGWAVNIVIVSGDKLNAANSATTIDRPYTSEVMETLQRDHGIAGYLDEFFTAPPAILQAMRQASNVDKVVVGSEQTQTSLDMGLLQPILETPKHADANHNNNRNSDSHNANKKIRSFCVFSSTKTKHFKTQSVVSRYSGKSSLRIDEVGPARMLAPGVSEEVKQRTRTELEELQSQLQDLQPDIESLVQQYQDVLANHQQASASYKAAHATLNEYENARLRLHTAQKKLQDLQQQASKDYALLKKDLHTKLLNHVRLSTAALMAAGQSHASLLESTIELAAIKLTEEGLEANFRVADQLYAEAQEGLHHLEHESNQVTKDFTLAKNRLAQLKQHAEDIAPMTDPATGEELPLKAQLEELPILLEELEAAMDECLFKMDRIADNPAVFGQYNARKLELEQKKLSLEEMAVAQNSKEATLKNEFAPWEAALVNTTQKVNLLFSEYMQELGCAGEVRLSRGESTVANPMADFKNWGIQIWVKFRQASSLQVLSAQVQSGGERSVSTIMYLMALQECMAATSAGSGGTQVASTPFRCVDEINQGLDERNERLVFRRIVENSTKNNDNHENNDHSSQSQQQLQLSSSNGPNHSGQYFLITPKLLPNLTDMEDEAVTILFIFNGPYNFKHFSDWSAAAFIKSQQRKRQRLRNDNYKNDDNDQGEGGEDQQEEEEEQSQEEQADEHDNENGDIDKEHEDEDVDVPQPQASATGRGKGGRKRKSSSRGAAVQ
jgi:chromosome segregation ATPase